MKKIFQVFIYCFLISSISIAQSTRLVTITGDDAYNAAGIGVSFFGEILDDGNLYFRGSHNAWDYSFWKTDGTISGTSQVLDINGSWDQIKFIEEGVLFKKGDDWSILKSGNSATIPLPQMPQERIFHINKIEDGSYNIVMDRDDELILYTANNDLSIFTEIGFLHTYSYSMIATSGTQGVVVFNGNSFGENIPVVYLKDSGTIMPINDYITSLSLSINELTHAYIHDKYMFVSYKDGDNFFKNKVIDMSTNTFADFEYIREPLEYFNHNNKLIMVTKREVISLDMDDMSNTVIFDETNAFTPIKKHGDKIYLMGDIEDYNTNIVQIDLESNTFSYLDDAVTGVSFYSCEIEFHNDEMYYIARDSHQLLMKYDFENNNSIVIDTLSISNGATVEHALIEVQDHLVLSKRTNFVQHELYVLGGDGTFTSSIKPIENIDVFPTLSEGIINLQIDDHLNIINNKVEIYNTSGHLVNTMTLNNNQIDITTLFSSNYFGILKTSNKHFIFKFVRK